jgi:hypothetical protein
MRHLHSNASARRELKHYLGNLLGVLLVQLAQIRALQMRRGMPLYLHTLEHIGVNTTALEWRIHCRATPLAAAAEV